MQPEFKDYKKEFATHFAGLLKLTRPDIPESDLEIIAKELAEITNRFALALKVEVTSGAKARILDLPAYSRWQQEMKDFAVNYQYQK